MTRLMRASILALPVALMTAGGVKGASSNGQDRPSDVTAARAIFDRAVVRIGGPATLRRMRKSEFTITGRYDNEMQAYAPPGPGFVPRPFDLDIEFAADLDAGHVRQAARRYESDDGGYNVPILSLASGGRRITGFEALGSYSDLSGGGDDLLLFGAVHVPALLLAMSSDRGMRTVAAPASASGIGLELAPIPGTRVQVTLDASGAVTSVRYPLFDTRLGATESVVAYSRPDMIDGIPVPRRSVHRRSGRIYFDHRVLTLRAPPDLSAEQFLVPAHMTRAPRGTDPTVIDLGEGVYDVADISTSTYRSQVVDMGPYLVVFDAPLSRTVTRRALDAIRRVLGPKPVRYVILSHFHEDHIGGVGTYIDEGATVVADRGDHDVIQAVVSASAAANSVRTVTFQAVGSEWRLAEGRRRLRVFRFGPVSHVASMLAVEIEHAAVILNADLYSPGVMWNSTFDRFLEWLTRDAAHITTVVGVHHGRVTPLEMAAERSRELRRRGIDDTQRSTR